MCYFLYCSDPCWWISKKVYFRTAFRSEALVKALRIDASSLKLNSQRGKSRQLQSNDEKLTRRKTDRKPTHKPMKQPRACHVIYSTRWQLVSLSNTSTDVTWKHVGKLSTSVLFTWMPSVCHFFSLLYGLKKFFIRHHFTNALVCTCSGTEFSLLELGIAVVIYRNHCNDDAKFHDDRALNELKYFPPR